MKTSVNISSRLDRLPATRTIWKLVALLSAGLFFEAYDQLLTAYIAPGLVSGHLLTSTTPGLFGMTGIASFIAVLFAGLFIATLACGFLSDYFGRRAVFTYSLLWYSAANLIMAFQATAGGLNFWRFISALGLGLEVVTIGTYISELAPKEIRGRAFAFSQSISFSSVPIIAFLSYRLVPNSPFGIEGWRWVVLIGSVGAVFAWWIRRNLPESPRWLAQKGRTAEADRVVKELEAQVESEYGQPLPPVTGTDATISRGQFKDMWIVPLYRRRVLMLSVAHLFQSIGYYGFASWVPTLLIRQGVTVTSSLLYASIIALVAPAGPLIGLLIADRIERKTVLVVMASLNVVCGLIFSQVTSTVLIILMGGCLTLAGNMISYTIHLYQQEMFPTGFRSRAAGFVYSWSRLTAIFNGFLIAFFLQRFGVTGVFLLIGAAMTVFIAVIGLMGPKTKNLGLEALS